MDATKIESFLLLAKSAKGRAAAEIVHKVTSEVGIYAFGELLEVQGIKEVRGAIKLCFKKLLFGRSLLGTIFL